MLAGVSEDVAARRFYASVPGNEVDESWSDAGKGKGASTPKPSVAPASRRLPRLRCGEPRIGAGSTQRRSGPTRSGARRGIGCSRCSRAEHEPSANPGRPAADCSHSHGDAVASRGLIVIDEGCSARARTTSSPRCSRTVRALRSRDDRHLVEQRNVARRSPRPRNSGEGRDSVPRSNERAVARPDVRGPCYWKGPRRSPALRTHQIVKVVEKSPATNGGTTEPASAWRRSRSGRRNTSSTTCRSRSRRAR